MCKFWSSVMLTSGAYKGRPIPAHIKITEIEPHAFRPLAEVVHQDGARPFPSALGGGLYRSRPAHRRKLQARFRLPRQGSHRLGSEHAADGSTVIERGRDIASGRSRDRPSDPADTLELWSPENGAEIQGVMWFVMLQKAMRQAFPDREPNLVVDCGSRADLAVEALRLGLLQVALKGSAEVTAKVADIAANCGGKRPLQPFLNLYFRDVSVVSRSAD